MLDVRYAQRLPIPFLFLSTNILVVQRQQTHSTKLFHQSLFDLLLKGIQVSAQQSSWNVPCLLKLVEVGLFSFSFPSKHIPYNSVSFSPYTSWIDFYSSLTLSSTYTNLFMDMNKIDSFVFYS